MNILKNESGCLRLLYLVIALSILTDRMQL